MKTALVAGATGFIGRALTAELARRLGPDAVVGFGSGTVDLTDPQATFDWFRDTAREREVGQLFHLAALYKAGDWPVHHPATQFHANMAMNVNLLEAWKRFVPGARLTSVVSYCMYPSHEAPHPEEELWGTEPEDYLFAYAFTKKALLVAQRAYRQEFGLDAVSAVLPTVYGPGDSFAEDSHVMGALIGKFVRAAREGRDAVEVWGDGRQEREFAFVDDVVDGVLAIAERSKEPVLNLGSGRAHAIDEIVALIREASGFRGRVVHDEQRFVGVRRRLLDVSRIHREIGWSAATSLRDGIARTVRHYAESLGREG